jgi:lipoprotein NlpI
LFVNAMDEMPAQTYAMLMEHYERTGQFAKAEDALYAILDADANNDYALNFGISFYERLLGRRDTELTEGNLPRTEVEAGLQELLERRVAKA